jgi:hypothetical protein
MSRTQQMDVIADSIHTKQFNPSIRWYDANDAYDADADAAAAAVSSAANSVAAAAVSATNVAAADDAAADFHAKPVGAAAESHAGQAVQEVEE